MVVSVQLGILLSAAVICAALILLLRPVLTRYALARPNARSSHIEPTPQGGGIAVIAATTLLVAGVAFVAPELIEDHSQLALVFTAVIGLAVVGATDDMRPLEALPRLVLQTAAVGVVIAALPAELRVLPVLPWWIERLLFLIGGVWFVNLVNFMDGIDWMTVAEVVPVTSALAVFGLTGALPHAATLVSFALCGAMIGFAPFNRPVARLFLGDVGSLPVGLLLGWLLVNLAARGHLTAALLLPLYYLLDTTVTLSLRLARGEPITHAHRSHFYQRAMANGFSVGQIVFRVFIVNALLIALAAASLINASVALQAGTFVAGCMIVSGLLYIFGHRRDPKRWEEKHQGCGH
jgi:UDP-N-acetylmuramyl pentapeptide phosphotransferase/UDP-N-acetylglucosamine-1-phosphate transferase